MAEDFQAINDNLVFVPFIVIIIELSILIRSLVLIKKERHGTEYTRPLLHTQTDSSEQIEINQPESF